MKGRLPLILAAAILVALAAYGIWEERRDELARPTKTQGW